MNNQTLIRISLIITLIGIFLLLFLISTIKPIKMNIKDISSENLNQKIQIKAKISGIKDFNTFQIISLNDSTGKINSILNKNSNKLNLEKNQTILITGTITEYNNELEIQTEKIQLLSLIK